VFDVLVFEEVEAVTGYRPFPWSQGKLVGRPRLRARKC
jgi:hypothetical protein